MINYIIRRLLLIIPTFFIITFIVFGICRLVPGGPIEKFKLSQIQQSMHQEGKKSNSSSKEIILKNAKNINEIDEKTLEEYKKKHNISDNFFVDYYRWIINVLSGNLGTSKQLNENVSTLIIERIPISLFHGLSSLFLIYLICIPLGMFKALNHQSLFDNLSSVLIFLAYSIPSYAFGSMAVLYFGSEWGIFPISEFVAESYSSLSFFEKISSLFMHNILPILAYTIGGFAFTTMLVKNTALDNLSCDYMKTALAKGVSYKKAVFNHVLDNTLVPLATNFGNNISLIIGGSFLIETIFNIDGMGNLGYNALEGKDYDIVMGLLVVSCILQMIGNLLSDICVAYVDPRVKFE